MSIEKKSLINTLKTAKKANIVKEDVTVSSATASPVRRLLRPVQPVSKTRGAAKKAPRLAYAAKK
jgi:hypothetical protein